MLTINAILEEIKDVPVDKLEDVYKYVHSLASKRKVSEKRVKKIMSFAGAFADMSEADYNDFVNHTKKVRAELFNRKFDI